MTEQMDRAESLERLADEIKDIRIAMLTTVDDDGMLRSRPMGTHDLADDGTLWFFTYADAPKVDEVEREQQVNVNYAKPDDNRWVSISGLADLVRDREKMEELWKPFLRTWFPKGVDDPELALLRVRIEKAEVWDESNNPIVYAAGLAKAVVTGRSSGTGSGEKLDLQ